MTDISPWSLLPAIAHPLRTIIEYQTLSCNLIIEYKYQFLNNLLLAIVYLPIGSKTSKKTSHLPYLYEL